jgi:chemotaxis protein methyltransferase CheR
MQASTSRTSGTAPLSPERLKRLSDAVHRRLGVVLGEAKRSLVEGRLARRSQELGLPSIDAYVDHLFARPAQDEEWLVADTLLTTNETYFFREARHFEVLEAMARHHPQNAEFRLWSAASSTGEEAFSAAMVLEDLRRAGQGPRWSILGTDISSRVLRQAASGRFPMQRIDGISPERLRRYCLRGTGDAEGWMAVDDSLRAHCTFARVNLMEPLPPVGLFEAIFLRNVLIYFDIPTKRAVIGRLLEHLAPGGRLFVGLAESLHGANTPTVLVEPGVYRKAEA